MFFVHTKPEVLNTQQSLAILDLCLKISRTRISHDLYCDTIFFNKLRLQNVSFPHENEKPAFSNSLGFKRASKSSAQFS